MADFTFEKENMTDFIKQTNQSYKAGHQRKAHKRITG